MRRRTSILLAVALLLAATMAGTFAWLRHSALRRFHCVGSVGYPVGLVGGVRLAGVDLRCERADIRVTSLTLGGSLAALLHGEPSRIQVVGGSVVIRMRRGSEPSSPGVASGSSLPTWSVEDLDVAVRDDGSDLASFHLTRAEGATDALRVELRDLSTSAGRAPEMRAAQVQATLVRDGAWRVRTLDVDGLSVSVTASPPLRGARNPQGDGDARTSLLDRFTDDARVTIRQAQIADSEGIAIESLSLEGVRRGGALVQLSGQGAPRGSGHMEWDVALDVSNYDAQGTVDLRRVPWTVFSAFAPEVPLEQPAETLLSGSVELRAAGSLVDFRASVSAERLVVSHARIAAAPVAFDFRFRGSGHWNRALHELTLDEGSVEVGSARMNVVGRMMRMDEHYAANLHLSLPSTLCQTAVAAIPRGLMQEVAGWSLEGSISAAAHLSVDSEHLDATELTMRVNDGCRFVGVPAMADVARFRAPFRHVVEEPDGSTFEMETGPGSVEWTPIREVSPFLVHAVIAHEDAAFFRHSGFAPWAIRDALVRNLHERRYVLGASTITMQLVKNVFLRREKTLARKVQEVLLTWWIERSMSKEEILELYLNVIEYGPEVYGVRHAASHYFGRTPAELSPAQAAYLAMILPNPPAFHEHFEAGAIPAAFSRRVQRFIDTLHERGRIDGEARAVAAEELANMRFSRSGERVGPELRGGSATLPIEGFSGMPLTVWADDATDPAEALDEPDVAEDVWEESYP